MKRLILPVTLLLFVRPASAAVDTLKDTTSIHDTGIHSYADCAYEIVGENCIRFNAGGSDELWVGNDASREQRALMAFPGWDGALPDSSKLMLYCCDQRDALTRRVFAYPLTRPFIEGSETDRGAEPEPDSGATWLHAFLDVGDLDSLLWTTPGGDYTTAVACTATVTDTGQYFAVERFDRLLAYWDSTGAFPGCVLVNEQAFPANASGKTFSASEDSAGNVPLLILHYPDSITTLYRRRGAAARILDE